LPAITSITPEFHAIRDSRYRYISYGKGQEELYDHDRDPEEWTNIAGDPAYSVVMDKLKKYIPQGNAKPLQGPYAK
jgi:type II restriction/modification system DNA methylase subunit YeeA